MHREECFEYLVSLDELGVSLLIIVANDATSRTSRHNVRPRDPVVPAERVLVE